MYFGLYVKLTESKEVTTQHENTTKLKTPIIFFLLSNFCCQIFAVKFLLSCIILLSNWKEKM